MASNQVPVKDVTVVLANLREIAEAVMQAASAGTLEQALQQIAEVTRELVGVRYVALGVPDGMGSLKYFKTVGLTPEEIARIGNYPQGCGLLGTIMDNREVVRLDNIAEDERSAGFPPHHPVMTTLLGVPIQLGDQFFGILYLCDRFDGQPFTEEDQWLVETLAGYAALALAGVQLSEQHARLVLLEERERVARELHDGIIQSLYAIGMQLQLIRLTQQHPDSNLPDIIHQLDQVIEDIRSYIMNLRTSTYERQTVRQCLEDVIARLHVPSALKVHLDAPQRLPPFPAPVLESVCQIAAEALSNVIRHAGASMVRVAAAETDEVFRLVIEDNGRGFDPCEDCHEGMGLRNMRQRARIHGGQVNIHSIEGVGTRVAVTIPLNSKK
ncbi:MAG: GAF domain-containing sensor histidine kinase [Chloroflexota bacterium]|nr:MAG: hypothetical protein DIU68_06280 [Chloroflexota bacterium]